MSGGMEREGDRRKNQLKEELRLAEEILDALIAVKKKELQLVAKHIIERRKNGKKIS